MTLSALSVFEDPTGGYTDTFAIFCRDQQTNQWKQAGHRTGNKSQFNLFTFPAIETSEVVYLWLKSADKHVRIAELEGYRASELGGL